MDFDEISRLLDEFGRLPQAPRIEPTILEIAGYPHYENVASNILAFFLDPNSGHGFEVAVLGSLLAASGTEVLDSDLDDVCVDREAPTESGRIDLLVETSP